MQLTVRIETSGTVEVEAGTLDLSGGTNLLSGGIAVAAGATLRIANATNHNAGSSISGAGPLEVSGTHNINADVAWSVPTETIASGALTTVSGDLTIPHTLIWTGGFIVWQNGHKVTLPATATGSRSAGVLHTGARIENHGTFTYPGALSNGSGTFDNRGTLTLANTQMSEVVANGGLLRKTGAGSLAMAAR